MKKKRLIGVLIILLVLTLTFFIGKYIISLASEEESFKELIGNSGIFGYIFFIFLTAIQVVLALIPSEALELAAGYTFGGVIGSLLCLIGICIGSACVLILAKKFGRKFVNLFYDDNKIDSIKLFNDEKKLIPLIFILFLIPGTPKDLMTYVIGLTKLKVSTYLLITSFARTPSIIISTIAGSAVAENNLDKAIIFICISIITGVIGFLIYRYVFNGKNATSK